MDKINIQYFNSSFGDMIIGSFGEKICICDWINRKMRKQIDARIQKGLNAEYHTDNSPAIIMTISQLKEYFSGERTEFDIPLLMIGTRFQKNVWEEILKIPFGKTITYLELSRRLGNEKSIRAVASANGANAISIMTPCHRVIGSKGDLVGYAGGLNSKKRLLTLETKSTQLELFY